jgi:hypothetical protein
VTSDAQARRLLALLVDEQAIETEPIADVRVDLAALGLDPARAVAMARRLVAGVATPAVTLLGKIDAAEESDDEIHRLEQADIGAVRRNLAAGTTAAATANAQRAAGRQASVVGLRRRRPRRLWYGLGGVAAALAASVVFFVGLSTERLHDAARDEVSGLVSTTGPKATNETVSAPAPVTPPAEEPYGSVAGPRMGALPAESADSEAAGASQQPASETDNLQARMQPSATGGSTVTEQVASAPASPQQSVDAETATRAKSEADAKKAAPIASQSLSSQLADAPPQSAGTVAQGEAGQSNTEELRGNALANQIAGPFGLNRPVTALLIVDSRFVPATVKQENYSTGDLRARLGDARRLAGGRPVAALVTLQLGDRPVDAVVIAGPANEPLMLRRDLDKTAEPSNPPASVGGGYDIMLLDHR